jgi:hypothetical protein
MGWELEKNGSLVRGKAKPGARPRHAGFPYLLSRLDGLGGVGNAGVEPARLLGSGGATFDFLELLLAQVGNDFFAEVQLVGELYLFHSFGVGMGWKLEKTCETK